MGCSNSNLNRPSSTKVTAEERLLQSHERQLFFSSKKVEDLLATIELINFPLDICNFPALCGIFKVSEASPSGFFLRGLLEMKQMTIRLLRHLTILLSDHHKIDKFSLIFASDKKVFLNTIRDLLHESIEVIPSCLENLERSVLVYVQSLRPVADQYLRELQRLTLEEIKEKVAQLIISSRDLRYKMYVDLMHESLAQGFDSKFDNFQPTGKNQDFQPALTKDFDQKEVQREENGKSEELSPDIKIAEKSENLLEKSLKTQENPIQDDNLKVSDSEDVSESISEQQVDLSASSDHKKDLDFIKITEEVLLSQGKKGAEENFEDKIPNISETGSFNDESLLAQLNESSIKPVDSSDIGLEDPKPEDPVDAHPIDSPLIDTNSIEVLQTKDHPVEDSPEENNSKDPPEHVETLPSIGKSEPASKSETKQKLKTPTRMSSGLAAKLKATQAFIRSNTLGKEKSSDINIGYSASHKQLGLAKMKLSGEAVSAHSAIPLESSLSESSLLRSSLKSRVEEEKNQHHRESKIGARKVNKK